MKDRKCEFSYSVKNEAALGGYEKKTGVGICRSEVVQKNTDKGVFAIVYVEAEDGQLIEAFANTIKFIK